MTYLTEQELERLQTLQKERRGKVYHLPMEGVLGALQGRLQLRESVVPEDAIVFRVRESDDMTGLKVVFLHESFAAVPPEEMLPYRGTLYSAFRVNRCEVVE